MLNHGSAEVFMLFHAERFWSFPLHVIVILAILERAVDIQDQGPNCWHAAEQEGKSAGPSLQPLT